MITVWFCRIRLYGHEAAASILRSSLIPPYPSLGFLFVLHCRVASLCCLIVKLFPIGLYRLAGKRCVSLPFFRFRYGPSRFTRSLLEWRR
jgi:hypothetical protein